MVAKIEELFERMDAEILEKVNAIALEKDDEIKAYAQKAYENAVEEKIAEYKAEVEKEYATARVYLEELYASEKTAQEVSCSAPIEQVIDAPVANEAIPEAPVAVV